MSEVVEKAAAHGNYMSQLARTFARQAVWFGQQGRPKEGLDCSLSASAMMSVSEFIVELGARAAGAETALESALAENARLRRMIADLRRPT